MMHSLYGTGMEHAKRLGQHSIRLLMRESSIVVDNTSKLRRLLAFRCVRSNLGNQYITFKDVFRLPDALKPFLIFPQENRRRLGSVVIQRPCGNVHWHLPLS